MAFSTKRAVVKRKLNEQMSSNFLIGSLLLLATWPWRRIAKTFWNALCRMWRWTAKQLLLGSMGTGISIPFSTCLRALQEMTFLKSCHIWLPKVTFGSAVLQKQNTDPFEYSFVTFAVYSAIFWAQSLVDVPCHIWFCVCAETINGHIWMPIVHICLGKPKQNADKGHWGVAAIDDTDATSDPSCPHCILFACHHGQLLVCWLLCAAWHFRVALKAARGSFNYHKTLMCSKEQFL